MKNTGAFKHNIWMQLYANRYEELFAYAMTLVGNDKVLAEEMVRSLSIAYFANEKKLREALAKLPPTYAEVLELFFLQAVPAKEITQKLPLSIYQVKRRLVVGMFYLRQEINPGYFTYLIRNVNGQW